MCIYINIEYWPEHSFKQYFNDWLVSFKQQEGNFFQNRKKIISQQTYEGHTFMTST